MKAIIVGLGGWGSGWAQTITDSPDWEIVGWVDTNSKALVSAVSNFGADPNSCFLSLHDAVRHVPADAAFIITPPNADRLYSITTAMDAGLHVLAEKPLADSLDDAKQILEEHKTYGVKLMVGQNYRFFPRTIELRKIIEGGEKGKLGYMKVLYHKSINMPGTHMEKMDNALILCMSIHHLDTIRFLIGSEPETLRAESWNPPWSWTKSDACIACQMTFPGDIRVNYFGGWAARQNETDWYGHWDLEFEQAAMFTDGVVLHEIVGDERKESPFAKIDPSHTRADVLREFTSAIKEDRTPACSIKDNIKTLLMAFAIIESARTGERVDFRAFARDNGIDL